MKRFELVKDSMGIKAGSVFVFEENGNIYWNLARTCQLSKELVENTPEFFKELPAFWTPTQGQTAYVIALDGSIIDVKMEPKFNKVVAYGTIFETKEQAIEVSEAIGVLVRTYQNKYVSEKKE